MKEIPTLFERDWEDRSRVVDKPHPDCAWVLAGEGTATRKVDGTSFVMRNGKLFKRRILNDGADTPPGLIGEGTDAETEQSVGWVPVGDGPEDVPQVLEGAPRTFARLREWLATQDVEGIVFHHPDGRMAQVTLRDFGLKRLPRLAAGASPQLTSQSRAPSPLPDIERMAAGIRVPCSQRETHDRLWRAALTAEKAFGRTKSVEMLRDIADALESDRTPMIRIT